MARLCLFWRHTELHLLPQMLHRYPFCGKDTKILQKGIIRETYHRANEFHFVLACSFIPVCHKLSSCQLKFFFVYKAWYPECSTCMLMFLWVHPKFSCLTCPAFIYSVFFSDILTFRPDKLYNEMFEVNNIRNHSISHSEESWWYMHIIKENQVENIQRGAKQTVSYYCIIVAW